MRLDLRTKARTKANAEDAEERNVKAKANHLFQRKIATALAELGQSEERFVLLVLAVGQAGLAARPASR